MWIWKLEPRRTEGTSLLLMKVASKFKLLSGEILPLCSTSKWVRSLPLRMQKYQTLEERALTVVMTIHWSTLSRTMKELMISRNGMQWIATSNCKTFPTTWAEVMELQEITTDWSKRWWTPSTRMMLLCMDKPLVNSSSWVATWCGSCMMKIGKASSLDVLSARRKLTKKEKITTDAKAARRLITKTMSESHIRWLQDSKINLMVSMFNLLVNLVNSF